LTEDAKAVEVQLSELKITKFFDQKFVKLMEEALEGIQFQHFCLYATKKTDEGEMKPVERIVIAHHEPEDADKFLVNVSGGDPETLVKVLKAMEEFLK
ncbi:MAG: hypothetical protein V3V91_01640, partial [Thermoplasmata archaeon]